MTEDVVTYDGTEVEVLSEETYRGVRLFEAYDAERNLTGWIAEDDDRVEVQEAS